MYVETFWKRFNVHGGVYVETFWVEARNVETVWVVCKRFHVPAARLYPRWELTVAACESSRRTCIPTEVGCGVDVETFSRHASPHGAPLSPTERCLLRRRGNVSGCKKRFTVEAVPQSVSTSAHVEAGFGKRAAVRQ